MDNNYTLKVSGENRQVQKNAIIEFMRFLFASIIVLFHAGADAGIINQTYFILGIEVSFFRYGYLGVEFFFVVSGYLMAKKAYKNNHSTDNELGLETWRFLRHKMMALMPVYIIACFLVSCYFVSCGKELSFFLERLPSLLFLQRTGVIDKEYIGIAWYLSSMFIGMAFIYPILRKKYELYTMCIGPIISILIIGYLIHETGYLGGVSDWLGISYKCNFRAFAELSLGATCFEIGRKLFDKEIDNKQRIIWSVVSIIAVCFVLVNVCSTQRMYSDGVVLLVICFIVVMSFSKIGIISRYDRISCNQWLCYMGELSMPVFLFQNVFHYWIPRIYQGDKVFLRIALIFISTLLFSIIINKALKRKKRHNLS